MATYIPADVALHAELNGKQTLFIAHSVRKRLDRHRQRVRFSKEAGGQLFGQITGNSVLVSVAVGPRKQDERSRTSFRSDPKLAQIEIKQQHAKGNLYLGEWHTHAEPLPNYSGADLRTMESIYARSALPATALLLLIRGTAPLPAGLAAYLYRENRLERVRLELVHT